MILHLQHPRRSTAKQASRENIAEEMTSVSVIFTDFWGLGDHTWHSGSQLLLMRTKFWEQFTTAGPDILLLDSKDKQVFNHLMSPFSYPAKFSIP